MKKKRELPLLVGTMAHNKKIKYDWLKNLSMDFAGAASS